MTETIFTFCCDCRDKAELEILDEWTHNGLPVVKTRCRNCDYVTTTGGRDIKEALRILGCATQVGDHVVS